MTAVLRSDFNPTWRLRLLLVVALHINVLYQGLAQTGSYPAYGLSPGLVDRVAVSVDSRRRWAYYRRRALAVDTFGQAVSGGIDEASRHVPIENLALSPQCGFASTPAGNLLTEEEQWRKLELVVATARSATSPRGRPETRSRPQNKRPICAPCPRWRSGSGRNNTAAQCFTTSPCKTIPG